MVPCVCTPGIILFSFLGGSDYLKADGSSIRDQLFQKRLDEFMLSKSDDKEGLEKLREEIYDLRHQYAEEKRKEIEEERKNGKH